MLQRQIMYKQLQEMQRRQQLQELGNNSNQNYVNQLSSLKQVSGAQFSPTVNETPVQDSSRMFMVSNMQTMQHGGPNGNFTPQFDISSYGTQAPNSDENLNQYSHLQGPSNFSTSLLTRNQPAFGSSFSNQRSNHISMPDASFVSNQESNLFRQVPVGGFNSGILSGNYPQQGFTMQKNVSYLESEKGNENAASLDPLEQKILYNTDDNSWESAFSRVGKMSSGGFGKEVEMSSIQSGSWSALMQSAVEESCSGDGGVQEEWSGLSFQNPAPLNDNENLKNSWSDRNLQNASSPSSNPENSFQNIDRFSNFQQPTQYIKPKEDDYHTESSHATMQNSPRNISQLTDDKSEQLIQGSLPLENIWPGEHKESSNNERNILSCANDNQPRNDLSGHEFGGAFWVQRNASDHMSSIQKKYDQMNHLNIHGYSVDPENMASVGVSNAENVIAPSGSMFELDNKGDISNDQTRGMQLSSQVQIPREMPNTSPVSPDFGLRLGSTDHPQTPQSYSFFPSLSMGSSSATPLSSHVMSAYIKNQHSVPPVQSHMATEFPGYSAQENSEPKISDSSGSEHPLLENMPESQPSLPPDTLQRMGFPMGLPTPWPENQNSFQHEYQQLAKGNAVREGSTEINKSTSLSRNTHEQEFMRKHHLESNSVESGPLITNPNEEDSKQTEMNQLNIRGYSVEPENMAPVGVSNAESMSAPSGSIFGLNNQGDISNDQTRGMQLRSQVPFLREMPNTSPVSPDFGLRLGSTDHPQTQQSYAFFPPLSTGISSATHLSNHIMSAYIKNEHSVPPVQRHMATEFPSYSAQENSEPKISDSSGSEHPLLENLPESQPSFPPDTLQHVGFPTPTPWPENQNSFHHEYQQLAKGNAVREGSTEINNSTSLSQNTHEQAFTRKHHLETNSIESGPLITNPNEQASKQTEVKNETFSFPARDTGAFRQSLNQNYSLLHKVLSTRNDEMDGVVKTFTPRNDNVNNHHSIANARKLLLSGLQPGVKDRAKNDAVSQFLSGKASSISYNQNSQQMDMFCQDGSPSRSTTSNDTPNLTYQSQISMQMAPSWFKHDETLKNGQILRMHDARALINAAQPFAEMTPGNLQENSLIMQVNLANTSQGSGVCPSTAVTSIASNQLKDVPYQNFVVSIPKKRKLVAIDMVPWHKEVHHEQSRLQDISTTEYFWAKASNRKPEEEKNEAEIVEELHPVDRAKRRLISTTQFMQQVFRPAPVVILCSDANLNCDCVAYFAARLALGDAWRLTSLLASDNNNMSSNELRTSKGTKVCEFSKAVEAFINRVKKVETDFTRLDKQLSIVDVKVEARELEKFSTINRFAKFHIRAHPITTDPASSSGKTTLLKANIQRYVVPIPMPEILPEAQDCISL